MNHRSSVFVLGLALALALALPAAARGEDAPFLGWSELSPGVALTPFEPSSADECKSGREQCVEKVIRAMKRRFEPLAESCDHDAIFSLAYLRTTEEYLRAIQDPDFFEDTRFVNHEDAVFAAAYFWAFEAYHAGAASAAPAAWRIAFRAAERNELPAYGDLALGINAHVQHDLPFVLAAIGIVKPDGTSRKRDHDRVNVFLNRVTDDLIAEIARRFDPTIDDDDLPTMVDDVVSFQIIPTWREIAWRNAERLVAARTPLARALVAADIEAYAASQAQTLRTLSAYPPGRDASERRAYCEANHEDG